jgi:prepilin-type processing-associated H-X9-DG protein
MGWQQQDKKKQNEDPRVNRAMTWLRDSRGGELAALGVFHRDNKNPDDYDHMTGTLQSALDLWQQSHGKPAEYKDVPYEGTSYEYPTRRLLVTTGTESGLKGKTREEALTSSRSGSNLASSKLWVLYEFAPFHMTGFAGMFAADEIDTNRLDDPNWEPPPGSRNFLYFDGHVDNL